ncbi:hypothetical protein Efla_007401 [Eimeria flavescens]
MEEEADFTCYPPSELQGPRGPPTGADSQPLDCETAAVHAYPGGGEEESDPLLRRLMQQITAREQQRPPVTSVGFRVPNAKQVSLEVNSTGKLVSLLQGLLDRLDRMLQQINKEKEALLGGLSSEALHACEALETMRKQQAQRPSC